MARRKAREDHMVPATPDKQLAHPSGFCMTGDHKDCPMQFHHGKCGCSCHKTKATKAAKGALTVPVKQATAAAKPRWVHKPRKGG